VLPGGLAELGATVDRIEIYRSVADVEGAARLRAVIEGGGADLITFTAGSGVQAYVEAVGAELAPSVPAASIGPVTSDAARAAGIRIACEAWESTVPGLVRAVVDYYARRG
jgi:uroporphyrinogen III methyltransferase/synthase